MKERWIVCAATKIVSNQGKEILLIGPRHWDRTMHLQYGLIDDSHNIQYRDYEKDEQGFIDQYGLFLTREEAWTIAQENGQIKRRVGGDERVVAGETKYRLFSENLY